MNRRAILLLAVLLAVGCASGCRAVHGIAHGSKRVELSAGRPVRGTNMRLVRVESDGTVVVRCHTGEILRVKRGENLKPGWVIKSDPRSQRAVITVPFARPVTIYEPVWK